MTRPTARTIILTDSGAVEFTSSLAEFLAPEITIPLVPIFTAAPSITGTAQVGEVATFSFGTVIDGTIGSRRLFKDGADFADASAGSIEWAAPGAYKLRVTITGTAISAESPVVTVVAAAPPADTTAPTITSTAAHSVPENTTYGATATANEAVTWTKGGADAALITLSAATGVWSIPGQNHEARPTVTFTLTARDAANNASAPQTITLTITDVDEVAPTITSPATYSVDEGTPLAGTSTADEAVAWIKGGTDAALVTLNPATGAWSIAAQDYAVRQSVSWTRTATDAAGNASAAQAVTITINEVVEEPAPEFAPATLTRTSSTGTNPPTFSMTTGDALTDTHSFRLEQSQDGFATIRESETVPFNSDFALASEDEGGFDWATLGPDPEPVGPWQARIKTLVTATSVVVATSNIITDTLNAAADVVSPSVNDLTASGNSCSATTTQATGRPVGFVWLNSHRPITSATYNGSACTVYQQAAPTGGDQSSIAIIVAPGGQSGGAGTWVLNSSSAFETSGLNLAVATFTNVSTEASHVVKAWDYRGNEGNGWNPGAVIIPGGGVGLLYIFTFAGAGTVAGATEIANTADIVHLARINVSGAPQYSIPQGSGGIASIVFNP